jgi:serine/threonine protein kinase
MPEPERPQGLEGALKVGSYRLVERLGSGGMSSVFRAVHDQSGVEVAVKILPRSLARNPVMLQRFLQEAKNAEALQHPNIVAIYDRGVDQGRYYLVLEFISGGDLHDRVKQKGPLKIVEAVAVIRAAAEGLRYAAHRGVIHRDIKPANLLMTPEGRIKITDLGLALRMEAEEDERVTRDGTTVGTVDYMAPEQARDSRATSVRSDIYSLGCTLYYLLTGSPPFAGGDVVEKLRRHAIEPPPDARKTRPEIPWALSLLIQRMMAKRPEDRFDSYDELIEALDSLPLPSSGQGAEPLYAIIDDEPPAQSEPLYALVDDEDEDRPSPQTTRRSVSEPMPSVGIDLSQLAPLDAPRPSSRPPSSHHAEEVEPLPLPRQPGPRSDSGALDAIPLEDEADEPIPDWARSSRSPAQPWILGAAVGGLAAVLLGVVLVSASSRRSGDESAEEVVEEPLPVPLASGPSIRTETGPRPKVIAKADNAVTKATTKAIPKPGRNQATAARDFMPRNLTEPAYPNEGEYLPAWAAEPVLIPAEGGTVTVQRIVAMRPSFTGPTRPVPAPTPQTVPTVHRALEERASTVEIADRGPFFEDDFRLAGRVKRIRAREGIRPIVVVGPAGKEFAKDQHGIVGLEGTQLILEGIDLVVDLAKLPQHIDTLFLCRGGGLTLNHCTVTVANPSQRPFALVRVEEGGTAPHIRIERSFLRGDAMTVLDLSGKAEVLIARSVVLNGRGPVVNVPTGMGASGEPRKLFLVRAALADSGAVINVSGPGRGAKALLTVKALGSVFARIESNQSAAALVEVGQGGADSSLFEWRGDFNTFYGWTSWMVAGGETALADLGAVRDRWAGTGTEAHSSQELTALPATTFSAQYGRRDLITDLPTAWAPLQPILAQAARPSAYLWEWTLGAFSRLNVPEADRLAAEAPTASTPQPSLPRPMIGGNIKDRILGFNSGGPGSARTGKDPAPPREGEIDFDANGGPALGDLGRFLEDTLRSGSKTLRIRARGEGVKPMTPVKLPEGAAVEIVVEPAPSGKEPLAWSPSFKGRGGILIDGQGADLTLIGARFAPSLHTDFKALIRIEEGNLRLQRCWLRAPGAVEFGAGGLIIYRASGWEGKTRSEVGPPLCQLVDCLLLTGGDAITAEVGRGVVALSNCAVAARGDAFVLWPRPVAPDQFAADLWLDRCTVVSGRGVVRLAPWPGAACPDRPWLVASHNTAFFDGSGKARENVLLRTDLETFVRGTLLWQAHGDAYDLTHFTSLGELPSALGARPDVKRQWIDLWGPSHIRNVSGPSLRGARAAARLLNENPRTGSIEPSDLAIDPKYPPGRKSLDIGADLRRLGVPAESSDHRRR